MIVYHNSARASKIFAAEIPSCVWGSIGRPEERFFKREAQDGARGTYLRNKGHQFSEVMSLFVWVRLKDFTNTVVVIPLLKEFFLVSEWIPLD